MLRTTISRTIRRSFYVSSRFNLQATVLPSQLSTKLLKYANEEAKNNAQLENYLKDYEKKLADIIDLSEMADTEPSLSSEANNEIKDMMPQLEESLRVLEDALISKGNKYDNKGCRIEIKPGVGGTEAALFANDLFEMYKSYCIRNHWKFDTTSNELLLIDKPGSFNLLKGEAGIHRVQRIPTTEKRGRIHTSAAGVVVLPYSKNDNLSNIDFDIDLNEVRIDIMRARGHGGQHVNTTDSAVRLTHLPTGITVSMQEERSQHRNKAKAFEVLKERLRNKEYSEKKSMINSERKNQTGTSDRSEKIKTYNFPHNRITDHRCNFSTNLEPVLSAEKLDVMLEAWRAHARKEKLKLFEDSIK